MEGGLEQQAQTPNEERHDTWPENDNPKLEPRIYVASLSDYNAGRLHGIWLDAAQEPEELRDQVAEMLATSKEPIAEEWAIHGYEGFTGLRLGEWEDLGYVSKVAKGITEHGEAYGHWAEIVDTDEELDQFEERYLGRWSSATEYADDVLEDLGLHEEVYRVVPENLRPYVVLDAEAFGRDLQIGGDITVIEDGGGSVWVFGST